MSDLERIREAYDQTRREQPSDYPALPEWQDLLLHMRELCIVMWHAGRSHRRGKT